MSRADVSSLLERAGVVSGLLTLAFRGWTWSTCKDAGFWAAAEVQAGRVVLAVGEYHGRAALLLGSGVVVVEYPHGRAVMPGADFRAGVVL